MTATDDDEIPFSDQLIELGFDFSTDGETMYLALGNSNLQIVVSMETNTRHDEYMMAQSLSLYWRYDKCSMHYGIRDKPTIGQIKTLITALKGE